MMFFPCWNCDKGGKGIPARCSDFMNCDKWCAWGREQNMLDEETDDGEDE